MRRIISYMNKINLCENDIVEIENNTYTVNSDGYLIDIDGGNLNIYQTAHVLFGVIDYKLKNENMISYSDYKLLELLKSLKYTKLFFDVDSGKLYATNMSKKQVIKYLLKNDINLEDVECVGRKVKGKVINSVLFVSETSHLKSLNDSQFYSINFLLRRYKNCVYK